MYKVATTAWSLLTRLYKTLRRYLIGVKWKPDVELIKSFNQKEEVVVQPIYKHINQIPIITFNVNEKDSK